MKNKITLDKKYKYRNGGNARIVAVDIKDGKGNLIDYPVYSVEDDGEVQSHTEYGKYLCEDDRQHQLDLIEIVPVVEREMWYNDERDILSFGPFEGNPYWRKIKMREVLDEDQA